MIAVWATVRRKWWGAVIVLRHQGGGLGLPLGVVADFGLLAHPAAFGFRGARGKMRVFFRHFPSLYTHAQFATKEFAVLVFIYYNNDYG